MSIPPSLLDEWRDATPCPYCETPPMLQAVAAGTESPCDNNDCRVESFRWRV